jgi:hypothetical protein
LPGLPVGVRHRRTELPFLIRHVAPWERRPCQVASLSRWLEPLCGGFIVGLGCVRLVFYTHGLGGPGLAAYQGFAVAVLWAFLRAAI